MQKSRLARYTSAHVSSWPKVSLACVVALPVRYQVVYRALGTCPLSSMSIDRLGQKLPGGNYSPSLVITLPPAVRVCKRHRGRLLSVRTPTERKLLRKFGEPYLKRFIFANGLLLTGCLYLYLSGMGLLSLT